MSELAKKQENREKGETRTQAILSDEFWVLKRYVDVEGADFLVQVPADTLEELWERKTKLQVFGVVQAKYFEGKNQVRISKRYVEDESGTARSDFFALLHTNDEDGEDVKFFFTAAEIQKVFYLGSDNRYYCFSITKTRDYGEFRNRKKRMISEIIRNNILKTEEALNRDLIKIVYYRKPPSIICIEESSNKRIYETRDHFHQLKQIGANVQVSIKSKTTGGEAIVGMELGKLDDFKYDPVWGAIEKDIWD